MALCTVSARVTARPGRGRRVARKGREGCVDGRGHGEKRWGGPTLPHGLWPVRRCLPSPSRGYAEQQEAAMRGFIPGPPCLTQTRGLHSTCAGCSLTSITFSFFFCSFFLLGWLDVFLGGMSLCLPCLPPPLPPLPSLSPPAPPPPPSPPPPSNLDAALRRQAAAAPSAG